MTISSVNATVSLAFRVNSLFIALRVWGAPSETTEQRHRVELAPLFFHVLRPTALIGLEIIPVTTNRGAFFLTIRNAHPDNRESHFKLKNTLPPPDYSGDAHVWRRRAAHVSLSDTFLDLSHMH